MKIIQTAERVSEKDLSDNYIFQRSLLAYKNAAKMVYGNVLELGTGNGYGIEYISQNAEQFTTIDKFKAISQNKFSKKTNVKYINMKIPPLKNIPSNSFDFVISLEVIEHIKNDQLFIDEVFRVLKNKGKFIVTTPNKKMSLTRNPWHIREYTIHELEKLLLTRFNSINKLGIFGNEKILKYYLDNKKSVEKIMRFDVFNLQYKLPRKLLQIPYDILNRINRKKLLRKNTKLVKEISMSDYSIDKAKDDCFVLFYIAEK